MRPVTDEFLLGLAGVCATVIGLFLVGVLFFVETVVGRPEGRLSSVLQPYMRAGTRIVLALFAMVLMLSLALVAFELPWATVVFVVLSLILVVSNVDTAIRIRSVTKAIGSKTLLVNEIVGSAAVVAIVALPWVVGGGWPSREGLTLSALIAFAAAFASVATTALIVYDMPRLALEPAAGSAAPASGATLATVSHSPTTGVYAATDDYAHAVEVRNPERILFVAGTMGLDPHGVPGASLADQLDLVWSNLRAILAEAGMTVDNVVRVTSYLRDAAYSDANAAARVTALGGRAVPTTAIVTQTLADDWLVEIELIAVA